MNGTAVLYFISDDGIIASLNGCLRQCLRFAFKYDLGFQIFLYIGLSEFIPIQVQVSIRNEPKKQILF